MAGNCEKELVVVNSRYNFVGVWLALLLSATPVLAETITGKVVGITDGDTIVVLDANEHQHKVRVAGIDAPEKKQPFGQRSKENLSRLVFGKEIDVHGAKRDRYQRLIGKVMVSDPECQSVCPKTHDAGLGQISAGLAWWYHQYAKDQSRDDARRYEAAQADAMARHAGIWSDAQPTPPWDWRKGRRGG